MIEDALPEEMRGRNITLDKKNMSTLLKELADKHPDKYVDVTKKLSDIGRQVATETGGYSIGLSHLKQMAGTKKTISEIRQKLTGFLADSKLNDKQRNESIIRSVGGYQQSLMDDVYKEGLAAKNPIAMQIMSGSRGNKMNLSSLLGSDLLYEDHRGDIIPVPVLKSYSQGLTPAEYWAGTYGARKSIISTKFATADAGFFGKQLNQVTHRLSVVDQDDPRQDLAVRGLPVDTDDMDNEGALLAHDFGGYTRNTVLTPKILKDLKARNFDRILVRSPMTGGSPDGGVYARDVGVRERGTLPGRGEMVGMTAAQAVAEPISQGQLSAKHSGGVAGQEKTVGGFQYINQLIQVPKTFKGGAAHTTIDGRVQKIEPAPAGGVYVYINDKPQYVGSGFDLKVKPGDDVEAGDIISEGMPNPSIITEHKGIGEGRKYFVKAFRDSMGSMGLRSHRRNIELIGRGLIDHVRMTEEYGDHVPDDVIPYSTLEHGYKPREGFQTIEPSRALNKYLEKPVLHYSIGTKVRPGMLKDMQYFGVKDITVHDKPAPFQPEMVRAMYNLHHDPDWMTRMYGSGLKSSLLDATHRGSTSSATGTSFVPGLAKSVDFGRVGQIRQSEPGLKPDLNTPVATPMTPNTDTEKLSSDALYHGSSLRLKNIEPRPSRVINNEAAVFGTPNRELALSFMAPWTDADLSLGSTNNEPYVLEERYPGAFEKIYKGKSGFLHHLPSADFAEDPRLMPTERIARKAVKPANVEEIKNLWDALQTSGIVLKRHGDKSNNKVANDDILPQQHIKFAEVYTANGDSVQGVGLRKLYHTLLDEKGISGLGVNNEETGNVELAFNGDEAQRKNVFDELATRIQAKTGKPVTFAPLAVPQQMTSVNLSNADAARLNAIHHLAYRMSNMYDPSDSAMHDDATFKQNMADRFRLSVTDKGLTGTVPSRAAEQLLGTRPMYSAMAPEHRVRDEDEAMKNMAPEHKQKLLSMLGTDRGFLSNTAGTNKHASDDLYFVKWAETDPSKVILISGHSGAGKSTVAKQLSDALGLPVTSIDDHPALKQIFKNDPENKHMTPGSIERRRYLDAARRMALDTINSAKDGAIVEGTQLAALRKQQLAQYPHRVLVTTPLTELLQQRLDRTKQRVEAKGNPWTPEVEAYRSELGRKLYDSNKSDMSRFGNTPGTLTHNTRADNVDSLLDNFRNQYKHADDILPGGIGDKYKVSDFPKKEMAKGVKTESEHTTNPAIAADISKDHLVEDPKYYTKLEKVEKKSAYSIADGIANVRRKDDTLSQLLEAKKHSDAKRYDHKNAILRKLMQQSPQDWRVDDTNAAHHGVTHVPTSFRLHTDPNVIPSEVTRQKQAEEPNSDFYSIAPRLKAKREAIKNKLLLPATDPSQDWDFKAMDAAPAPRARTRPAPQQAQPRPPVQAPPVAPPKPVVRAQPPVAPKPPVQAQPPVAPKPPVQAQPPAAAQDGAGFNAMLTGLGTVSRVSSMLNPTLNAWRGLQQQTPASPVQTPPPAPVQTPPPVQPPVQAPTPPQQENVEFDRMPTQADDLKPQTPPKIHSRETRILDPITGLVAPTGLTMASDYGRNVLDNFRTATPAIPQVAAPVAEAAANTAANTVANPSVLGTARAALRNTATGIESGLTGAKNFLESPAHVALSRIGMGGANIAKNTGMTGLNFLKNLITSPIKAPGMSILTDALVTGIQGNTIADSLNEADKWDDGSQWTLRTLNEGADAARRGDVGTAALNFGKGTIYGGMQGLYALMNPVETAQTAIASANSPGRYTPEGQVARRISNADFAYRPRASTSGLFGGVFDSASSDTGPSNVEPRPAELLPQELQAREPKPGEPPRTTVPYVGLPGYLGTKPVQEPLDNWGRLGLNWLYGQNRTVPEHSFGPVVRSPASAQEKTENPGPPKPQSTIQDAPSRAQMLKKQAPTAPAQQEQPAPYVEAPQGSGLAAYSARLAHKEQQKQTAERSMAAARAQDEAIRQRNLPTPEEQQKVLETVGQQKRYMSMSPHVKQIYARALFSRVQKAQGQENEAELAELAAILRRYPPEMQKEIMMLGNADTPDIPPPTAPPRPGPSPYGRMSQGLASQQMAAEQAKRDADRRKYQYQRPRQ